MNHKSFVLEYIQEIDDLLNFEYGSPDHNNKDDPLDELFFILLSRRTRRSGYETVYDELRAEYPTWEDVAKASDRDIFRIINSAGLGNLRLKQIKYNLDTIKKRFKKYSLDRLYRWGAPKVFEYLTSLKGIGPKSAYCVMMYSFKKAVFPADTHVRRICKRLGLIDANLDHKKAQIRLSDMFPKKLRYSLHVNMISHGRKICRKSNPDCKSCIISGFCMNIRDNSFKDTELGFMDLFAGLLVRFRNCLDEGGYESAERFIKEILPSLNLILERIDDELEISKKKFIKRESTQDNRVTVDLEDVSNIISNLLIKIPHDEPSPQAAVDRIPAEAGMEENPPFQRPDGIIQTTLLPLDNGPHSQKVKSSSGPQDSAGVTQASDRPSEYVNAASQPAGVTSPVNQYTNPQSVQIPTVETVQVSHVSGEKINVTLPSTETRSVPQQIMETVPVNPAAPGDIPATSALAHVTNYDGPGGTPGAYYIRPMERDETGGTSLETREATESGGMYSAEESSPNQAGSGRYSSEYNAVTDFFIPEETGKYTPGKIDIYIRYSNLHMEQGNYDEALKFIAMAKELPDYFEHEYYRAEIMELEDTIERNRYRGVNVGEENVIDLKYTGFDYISQKGKTKAWHEDDDF